MTNTNVQSPIPLHGPGYVYRLPNSGGYAPGEMKKLLNCEFINDKLVTRRQVSLRAGGGGAYGTLNNPCHLTGSIKGLPGVVTIGGIAFGSNIMGSTLPAVGAYNTTLEQALEYRDVSYVLALEHESATPSNRRLVIYKVTSANAYEPNFNTGAARTIINGVVSSDPTPTSEQLYEAYGGSLRGGFIFKDRLFVACEDKVYWSKATDPTVWTAPDGGFITFDVPGNILSMVAINDSIYVASADKIFVMNYNVDINTELTVRQVNVPFGAFSMTVHRDSVYAVSSDGIYRIQGVNVEKLIDNPIRFGAAGGVGWKLLSHDDYLYLLYYSTVDARYDSNAVASAGRYHGRFPDSPINSSPTYFYALNMETGCLFEYLINWPDNTRELSYVVDIITGTDASSNNNIYFLLNDYTGVAGGIYAAQGYILQSDATKGRVPYDQIDPGGSGNQARMCIDVEWDQFVPDGSEMLMKKFRNLAIDGTFPYDPVNQSLKCGIAFDNKAYRSGPPALGDNTGTTSRPPYPHRVPMNQRGRAANIRIYNINRNIVVPSADVLKQRFEISDMRLLWSYTQRVTEVSEQNKNP